MNRLILQPVSDVALISIKQNKPASVKYPQAHRRLAVMFMDFGDPFHIVNTVVYRMGEGDLGQPPLREKPSYHPPEGGVHSVIIIGVQESAAQQMVSQGVYLFRG